MAKKIKKQYFLFGEQVCWTFNEEGLKKALKIAKTEGYAIYCWDENSTPYNLLYEYSGWNSFEVLTEEEYNAFAKL